MKDLISPREATGYVAMIFGFSFIMSGFISMLMIINHDDSWFKLLMFSAGSLAMGGVSMAVMAKLKK